MRERSKVPRRQREPGVPINPDLGCPFGGCPDDVTDAAHVSACNPPPEHAMPHAYTRISMQGGCPRNACGLALAP